MRRSFVVALCLALLRVPCTAAIVLSDSSAIADVDRKDSVNATSLSSQSVNPLRLWLSRDAAAEPSEEGQDVIFCNAFTAKPPVSLVRVRKQVRSVAIRTIDYRHCHSTEGLFEEGDEAVVEMAGRALGHHKVAPLKLRNSSQVLIAVHAQDMHEVAHFISYVFLPKKHKDQDGAEVKLIDAYHGDVDSLVSIMPEKQLFPFESSVILKPGKYKMTAMGWTGHALATSTHLTISNNTEDRYLVLRVGHSPKLVTDGGSYPQMLLPFRFSKGGKPSQGLRDMLTKHLPSLPSLFSVVLPAGNATSDLDLDEAEERRRFSSVRLFLARARERLQGWWSRDSLQKEDSERAKSMIRSLCANVRDAFFMIPGTKTLRKYVWGSDEEKGMNQAGNATETNATSTLAGSGGGGPSQRSGAWRPVPCGLATAAGSYCLAVALAALGPLLPS